MHVKKMKQGKGGRNGREVPDPDLFCASEQQTKGTCCEKVTV